MQNLDRELLSKFFNDPDWSKIEEHLKSYIDEMNTVMDIDTKGRSADEVMAEVIGRQKFIDKMTKFLTETGYIKPIDKKVATFR